MHHQAMGLSQVAFDNGTHNDGFRWVWCTGAVIAAGGAAYQQRGEDNGGKHGFGGFPWHEADLFL